MKNVSNRICIIVFSFIFVLGFIFAFYIPEYADYKLGEITEKYTTTTTAGSITTTSVSTDVIDRLAPSCEMSGILISAGLQLLGICGIVATIIKKDN